MDQGTKKQSTWHTHFFSEQHDRDKASCQSHYGMSMTPSWGFSSSEHGGETKKLTPASQGMSQKASFLCPEAVGEALHGVCDGHHHDQQRAEPFRNVLATSRCSRHTVTRKGFEASRDHGLFEIRVSRRAFSCSRCLAQRIRVSGRIGGSR